jgi:hypothetical protein
MPDNNNNNSLDILNSAVQNDGFNPTDIEGLQAHTGAPRADVEAFCADHSTRIKADEKVLNETQNPWSKCNTYVFNMGLSAPVPDPFEDIRPALDSGDVAEIDPVRLIAFVTAGSPAAPEPPKMGSIHVKERYDGISLINVAGQRGRGLAFGPSHEYMVTILANDPDGPAFENLDLGRLGEVVPFLKGKDRRWLSAVNRYLSGDTPDRVIKPED